MKRDPAASPDEARLVDFMRSNEALRAELGRLRANYDLLAEQFAVAVSGGKSDRERHRAALNLMEDAVLARRAKQLENEVRRRTEDDLREANSRKDHLLATLRESERALQESAARQAMLLELADRSRAVAQPAEIMHIATEVLARYLGSAAAHFLVIDEGDAESARVGAAFATDERVTLDDGAVVRLGDWPEWAAPLRRGEVVRTAESDPGAPSILFGDPSVTEMRWVATAPVVREGRLVAALTVSCPDERAWTNERIHFHRDITDRAWDAVERASAFADLRESNADRARLLLRARAAQGLAEEASRAKDDFLATLSHELRTPIAAILLWAGVLKGGAFTHDNLDRAIRAIVESAQSQSRLIEDLLELSCLTAGKVRLVPALVDVGALVQSALEMVRPAVEAKGQTLDVSLAPLGDAWLDGPRLKQVFWNVLSNATKFTSAGGRIALRARRHDGRLEIEVSDDGAGIAPEFMPHIFERFRQAHVGETRTYAGLGIGLALSRQLIDLQGGTIHATSNGTGRGSAFRVSVPWAEPPHPRELAWTTRHDEATPSPGRTFLSGVTVLLVEDDPNTGAAMTQVLQCAGATVRAFSNGADALAGIEAMSAGDRKSFVLVSDLGLPGMSGFELIQRVLTRDDAACHAVPACAISAHARDEDRERALEAGFDLFISKPLSPQHLVEAVRDLQDIAARL